MINLNKFKKMLKQIMKDLEKNTLNWIDNIKNYIVNMMNC